MTTTSALLAALEAHYTPPNDRAGGLFVPEVSINGGWGAGRRCDAVHVGFTSASGHIMRGHELKVSRSDWLHELNDITKSDTWASACHEWWLVVSDPAIVKDGELPPGWGLLAPKARGRRMRIITEAARKPQEFDPPWWAARSIMSRVDSIAHKARFDDLAKIRDEERERAQKSAQGALKAQGVRQATPEEARLLGAIESLGEQGLVVRSWARDGGAEFSVEHLAQALVVARSLDDLGRKYGGDVERLAVTAQNARDLAATAAETADQLKHALSRVQSTTREQTAHAVAEVSS